MSDVWADSQAAQAIIRLADKNAEVNGLKVALADRDATIARLREAEWQPIETAPKDGTEVLSVEAGLDEPIHQVRWVTGSAIAHGGYWSERRYSRIVRPTHWMPLPAAPLTPANEAEAAVADRDATIARLTAALADAERTLDTNTIELVREMKGHRRRADQAESAIADRDATIARLREALTVILSAARGDEKSECWTIRKWLDAQNVFNGDIQGSERLIAEAARAALKEAQ